MTVTVLGEPYKVPKAAGSAVNIQLGVNDWKIFKRHKHEADAALQARIHEWLANERAVRTRQTPPIASSESSPALRVTVQIAGTADRSQRCIAIEHATAAAASTQEEEGLASFRCYHGGAAAGKAAVEGPRPRCCSDKWWANGRRTICTSCSRGSCKRAVCVTEAAPEDAP
jgi:hypothetical protein